MTGIVQNKHLKQNNTAEAGCKLYLTKPLGIGILTTALKQKKLKSEHQRLAPETMCQLNKIGAVLGELDSVKAMTDVTGFGLLGHLREMCEGSSLRAEIDYSAVPKLEQVEEYIRQGCSPGGAQRNFDSYGHKVGEMNDIQRALLCDPQTSGGLLIALDPAAEAEFYAITKAAGLELSAIGQLLEAGDGPLITVK